MSDVEPQELKGGHAPAVKVGGMRVVQHKQDKPEEKSPAKPTEEEIEEFGEDVKDKKEKDVVVSGALTGLAKAFPEDAVKSFHEKPVPTHQKGANMKPKVNIQQPTKQ